MVKMVTHTKAQSSKTSLKSPQLLLGSLEFVIYQNLEHDTITVSNLAQS